MVLRCGHPVQHSCAAKAWQVQQQSALAPVRRVPHILAVQVTALASQHMWGLVVRELWLLLHCVSLSVSSSVISHKMWSI